MKLMQTKKSAYAQLDTFGERPIDVNDDVT